MNQRPKFNLLSPLLLLGCWALCSVTAWCQVEPLTDAPPPLDPLVSAEKFQVPPGYRVELVASEPLIHEPSGVCWNERGEFFVCELHGYNLEGQYDIEELNKSGELDRVVRRVQASDDAKRKADQETYGTIKRLVDHDGDGRMDEAKVWADRLPSCHGICPAGDGLVVAGHNQILFLADRDGDGQAEVRETLFAGFGNGPLERSLNCPQWGTDGWIYVGRGPSGSSITGPRFPAPVQLPHTDFRMRADGRAIEPVVGGTHTMGFAWTAGGDRFVISTATPGIFVAPLTWQALARNPFLATGNLEINASDTQQVFPTSAPHPWRTRRAEDPGFAKYYTDHYGIAESAPNGYFTSACSPLVYEDELLPELFGQLLACEPAQNLVHRSIIRREGSLLKLHRPEAESQAEFLTSTDPWFHPIALSVGPDGCIYIVDFYREIIEDYSAIPRYLQQQYGLVHGRDRGRIWRLTHEQSRPDPWIEISQLDAAGLAKHVGSPRAWRRETARRLLRDLSPHHAQAAVPILAAEARRLADSGLSGSESVNAQLLSVLHALHDQQSIPAELLSALLSHPDPLVRRQALRYGEDLVRTHPEFRAKIESLTADPEPLVRLQVALVLGNLADLTALDRLAELGRQHGAEPWMAEAILSGAAGRGAELLSRLLGTSDEPAGASTLLPLLLASIAAERSAEQLSRVSQTIAELKSVPLQAECLRQLADGFPKTVPTELDQLGRESLLKLAAHTEADVRIPARTLIARLDLEPAADRAARLADLRGRVNDVAREREDRLAAVRELAAESDPVATDYLLESLQAGSSVLTAALVDAMLSDRQRLTQLWHAIDDQRVPVAMLSSVQREALLRNLPEEDRGRAEPVLRPSTQLDPQLWESYRAALSRPRDVVRGGTVFREKCGVCHTAHGVGTAVGPDLSAEFQRAEETIVQDVLTPSGTISPGYVTYVLATKDGRSLAGLMQSESASNVNLVQAEGRREVILRNNIEALVISNTSMMPSDLWRTVDPSQLADVIAWLRTPGSQLTLFDDNQSFVDALTQGGGTAELISDDAATGRASLRLTPLQRHAPRIPGWEFRIREKPAPGEYRYLRFSWKGPRARGVMLELADNGAWPPADQAVRRYVAGENSTPWQAVRVAEQSPAEWTTVTRDLWSDFGDFTLTGIAPTTMGGPALFDRIELSQHP
ncbi:MAG: PVC-type heme-binding CxxCH protein [Pirellulales bacterium]